MTRKSNLPDGPAELRRRAELRLRGQRTKPAPKIIPAESQRQLHELEVHQIELEMQNAELQKARSELEVALEKYTDLYDFAPVGYFTLAASGVIKQVNLTGASLVGIERARLAGQPFRVLISAEQRPGFDSFLHKVFANLTKQSKDFELSIKGQPARVVSIEALRLLQGQDCRMAVMDITERKRAEEALQEREVRLQAFLKNSAIIGWLKDEDGRHVFLSENFERRFGVRMADWQGKTDYEVWPPKIAEQFRRNDQTVLASEKPIEVIETTIDKEGRRTWWLNNKFTFRDTAGRRYVGGLGVDITERQRAEETHARLAAIVESSEDAIIGQDLKGIITSWNNGAEQILGYSASEMVGTSILRVVPPDRRAEGNLILRKVRRGEGVQHFETLRRTKQGRLINVSITSSPIRDASGQIIGASKVARDITERKRAEALLRQNEAMFSALIAQAPIGVYVVDDRMCLRQVNPQALSPFRKIHPLIGRDFSEIVHIIWPKRVADQVVERFRHTLKTGSLYQSLNFAQRRRDTGVKEIYEWQIQRVTLPTGAHGVVCFFSDITERKRAEAAQRRNEVLAASNRKLEQEIVRRRAVEAALKQSARHERQLLVQSRRLQKQQQHLAHQILLTQEEERRRISRELHDVIAQTLTGINVRLATLKRESALSTNGIDPSIDRTQQLVQHSVRIIHRFARELRPAVLDDLGLMPALQTFLKHFKEETGIHVSLSADTAAEEVDGDKRTVLFRVAQEALTNIARHARASRAGVEIRKLDNGLRMTIKDDGRGFPPERIMRGRRTNRLGLLGMRERVEMVRGSFTIQSAAGKGTTVAVQIPLAEVAAGGGRWVRARAS